MVPWGTHFCSCLGVFPWTCQCTLPCLPILCTVHTTVKASCCHPVTPTPPDSLQKRGGRSFPHDCKTFSPLSTTPTAIEPKGKWINVAFRTVSSPALGKLSNQWQNHWCTPLHVKRKKTTLYQAFALWGKEGVGPPHLKNQALSS